MKVKDLIQALGKMPQDADVLHLWDGGLRTAIEIVYLARSGEVATADYEEVCYSDESRPVGAPTRNEDPYWHTPKKGAEAYPPNPAHLARTTSEDRT